MQLGALKAVLDSFAFMDILMDRFVSFLSPFIPRGERENEREREIRKNVTVRRTVLRGYVYS